MSYPLLLGLTVLVELALLTVLAPRGRRGAVLAAGLGVNAMTHPLAFALHAAVGSLACIEVGVIALEALGYHLAVGLARSRALLLASLANGATWGLGYLL